MKVKIWLAICPHDYNSADVVVCHSLKEARRQVREWKEEDWRNYPYIKKENIEVTPKEKADEFGVGLLDT